MITKTVEYDAYAIGDRTMEGVMFNVDVTLNADGTSTASPARPKDISVERWCQRLGGPGGLKHWCDQVDQVFTDEDTRLEELGEAMTDEEYDKYEDILLGR